MKLLQNLPWDFNNKYYQNPAEFDQDVKEYVNDLVEGSDMTDLKWNPEEIVIDKPSIQIHFPTRIYSKLDLLPNECLVPKYKQLVEESTGQELLSVIVGFNLVADNGKNFTALEFVMKLQNQQANKPYHYFYEGVELIDQNSETPTYEICVGT